jgi:hypothetical protein
MPANSRGGCLVPPLVFGAIAAVLYFEPFKPAGIYTPGVMPDPANKSEWIIFGPNFRKREQATDWAIGKARQYGPQASWIVYRDLFWNEEYGMPVAKEKLR